MDKTDETLKHWRQVPFSYENEEDCLMSLADHVQRVTGFDFGKEWRGKYRNEQQAFELIDKYGGSFKMINASGLEQTDKPERGDIVLVDVKGRDIGGLFTGDSVAMRLPHGVGEINAKFIKINHAWRVR